MGVMFEIRIKKECVDVGNGKPPSFYLQAKDMDDLKKILIKNNITLSEVESMIEKDLY
tara:strand:+ start:680 stop:853 length:174 start_codon:yes stop_codon:yes gene_type:complete